MKELENWDEARYKELNNFFRMRIQDMVDADPHIKELMEQDNGLQLQDIIANLAPHEQEMWQEFIYLDKLKLQIDMYNHLHGKGTPYNPLTGFANEEDDDEDMPPLW
jgi:chemotaxis response regulator CheB